MSHDKYFYGKKTYILLAPRHIYQKQQEATGLKVSAKLTSR